MKHASDARELDDLAVTTIRTLAMDAVRAAASGHPGTPMAMAPVAYTLWQEFLRFDPADPTWPNRDRLVLSIGHASALLYALLHLAGVKAVNPGVRDTRQALGITRRTEALPAAGLPLVLPPSVAARVAVEQASTFGWERYVGPTSTIVGMSTSGASAPLKDLQRLFGFTPDAVVDAVRAQLAVAVAA